MLDLNLLEKQLDEALEKETSESLTSWLLNRRAKKYMLNFGIGKLTSYRTETTQIQQSEKQIIKSNIKSYQDYVPSEDDLLAA